MIRLSASQAAEITHASNGIGEVFLEIEDERPEFVALISGENFSRSQLTQVKLCLCCK